jgi:hypothetical protein
MTATGAEGELGLPFIWSFRSATVRALLIEKWNARKRLEGF